MTVIKTDYRWYNRYSRGKKSLDASLSVFCVCVGVSKITFSCDINSSRRICSLRRAWKYSKATSVSNPSKSSHFNNDELKFMLKFSKKKNNQKLIWTRKKRNKNSSFTLIKKKIFNHLKQKAKKICFLYLKRDIYFNDYSIQLILFSIPPEKKKRKKFLR